MLFFNPQILFKHHKRILIVLTFFTIVFAIASLLSVNQAQYDYLQGVYSKILYIHVPSAWLSISLYVILSISAITYLVTKNPIYDTVSYALAYVGALFTLITLVTGSIWGRPTWGTWWVWDARLTSVLILLLTYFGYIALRKSIKSNELKNANFSSVFAAIGLINIPVIKLSVYLWNTLHQKSTFFKMDGPSIHSSMIKPIFYTTPLFISLALIAFVLKFSAIIMRKKLDRLKRVSKVNDKNYSIIDNNYTF